METQDSEKIVFLDRRMSPEPCSMASTQEKLYAQSIPSNVQTAVTEFLLKKD